MPGLDKAMLDFELALLSGDISNSTFQNVQNGNVSSMATYQSQHCSSGSRNR